MATAITPTTELEAVNILLEVIGESPINALTDSAVVDAVNAKVVLSEISRAVQKTGWHFNTEENYVLVPSVFDKEINVPANCVRVTTTAEDRFTQVALRGTRLYDKTNHTFKFNKSLKVSMVILLPFEELPEAARYYITIRAARTFQGREVGSDTLEKFTEVDEMRALADLKDEEGITGKHNMLTDSWTVARILSR